jgi:hypothetical protein
VLLAKSSAFRRSVVGASEFARTGAMASRAFCAAASIFDLSGQGVALLAIVIIPFFEQRNRFEIRSVHICLRAYSGTRGNVNSAFRPSSRDSRTSARNSITSMRITQSGAGRTATEPGISDCSESCFQLLDVRNSLFCTPLPVACSLMRFLLRHCCYSFLCNGILRIRSFTSLFDDI